jgi:hypothetical protein
MEIFYPRLRVAVLCSKTAGDDLHLLDATHDREKGRGAIKGIHYTEPLKEIIFFALSPAAEVSIHNVRGQPNDIANISDSRQHLHIIKTDDGAGRRLVALHVGTSGLDHNLTQFEDRLHEGKVNCRGSSSMHYDIQCHRGLVAYHRCAQAVPTRRDVEDVVVTPGIGGCPHGGTHNDHVRPW